MSTDAATISVPWPPLQLGEAGWRYRLESIANQAEALIGRKVVGMQQTAELGLELFGLIWPAYGPETVAATARASLMLNTPVVMASAPADQLQEIAERLDAIYEQAQCATCHRLAGEGGAIGPDLTGAGAKYNRLDLLRSLLEPSAVISEHYQATLLTLKNGDTLAGRITGESASVVAIVTDPIAGRSRDIPKADITNREASPVSPMPEGLLNTFTAEEILDLLAYLERP